MRQNGVRSNVRFPYGSSGGMKKGGSVKKQGYKDRKDESIAMRIKKKITKKLDYRDFLDTNDKLELKILTKRLFD